MNNPKPEPQNVHIIALAKWVVALPVVFVKAVYAWGRRRRRAGKSEKVLHAEDGLRQSRVRRGLRGLPPDHVQRPAARVQ